MRSPESELAELDQASLRRRLRPLDSPQGALVNLPGGQAEVLNFSSNDYLGLSNAPWLVERLMEAVAKHGAGSGSARLVCGSQAPHHDLEHALASIKKKQAALSFSSGYAAAVGTVSGLMRKGDILILDKLCHASLIDGARLSGATLRVFPHNHLGKLESLLQWAAANRPAKSRVMVVTESVFSMDGDQSPLAEIVWLKNAYDALLLVDEAHAFGLLNSDGAGLCASMGLSSDVDLVLGTLSKAVGLSGGFVAASSVLIELIINTARSFIYSTAPSPALAAAAAAVIRDFLPTSLGQAARQSLWQNLNCFTTAMGLPTAQSAILPLILGAPQRALDAAAALLASGLLVPAIRYPTVGKNAARLRITLTAAHRESQILQLAAACRPWLTIPSHHSS